MKLIKFKDERIEMRLEKIKDLLKMKKNKKYSKTEDELRDYYRNTIKEFSLDNKCIFESCESKGVLTDKLIEAVNTFGDYELFEQLPKSKKYKMFDNLIGETCKYLGIKKPTFTLLSKYYIDVDLSDDDFYELISKEDEYSMDLLASRSIATFAESGPDNHININYFTKKYLEYSESLGFDDQALIDLIGINYIITIRHECQHLLQFAKTKELLNGGVGTDLDKIMTNYELMFSIKDRYDRENKINNGESFGISYINELFEIDARNSEIVFMLELLSDDRVSNVVKENIKEYVCNNYGDYLPFMEYGEMKTFVEKSIACGKNGFETIFKYLPEAQKLIKDFESLDISKYYDFIDEIENNYMAFLAFVSKEKGYWGTSEEDEEIIEDDQDIESFLPNNGVIVCDDREM